MEEKAESGNEKGRFIVNCKGWSGRGRGGRDVTCVGLDDHSEAREVRQIGVAWTQHFDEVCCRCDGRCFSVPSWAAWHWGRRLDILCRIGRWRTDPAVSVSEVDSLVDSSCSALILG